MTAWKNLDDRAKGVMVAALTAVRDAHSDMYRLARDLRGEMEHMVKALEKCDSPRSVPTFRMQWLAEATTRAEVAERWTVSLAFELGLAGFDVRAAMEAARDLDNVDWQKSVEAL